MRISRGVLQFGYRSAVVISLAACAAHPTAAPPEGLRAYKEGMRKFNTVTPSYQQTRRYGEQPTTRRDYSETERVLLNAAAAGLPHAHYGLACAIYASGDRERYPEARAHAEHAAGKNVFEAQVLLISYYQWGIGGSGSTAAAEKAREAVYETLLRQAWPVESGAPGTLSISSREKADALLTEILQDGKCAPRTALRYPAAYFQTIGDRALPDGNAQLPMPVRKFPPNDPVAKTPDGAGSLYPLQNQ